MTRPRPPGRPPRDPAQIRQRRLVYLSDAELQALAPDLAQHSLSEWLRQKLLGVPLNSSEGASELPPTVPEKELLVLPSAGKPDAQGWCYHFEARNIRGDGTLTITRPGKPRLAIDFTRVEITDFPDRQELRFEDRTHPREVQEESE